MNYEQGGKEMNKTKKVGFKRLAEDAIIPTREHSTDSGFDLYANEDVVIYPGATKVISTGIAVQLPVGCEAQVRPRSGVTSKTKLRVQLGTIDNDYVGDIGIIVDNISLPLEIHNDYNFLAKLVDGNRVRVDTLTNGSPCDRGTYLIRKGDRIAQLVVQYLPKVEGVEVDNLDETERGGKGFGSSGV